MQENQKSASIVSRPPIVAVLGHVDHGKTTLLDSIRKTSVTKREAGRITQSIGASAVLTKSGKQITFIDTPGHATFSKMRSTGATAADIAILVVAADDGPKPQTLEALEIIRTAGVPMIVAFTKVDLATASVEIAQGALEQHGVYFESRGGDVPWVAISSKTGQGVEELLELISLLSEVNGISGDTKAPLEAVVIETARDKRGQLVSVIVKNGQIKVGDEIITDGVKAKVKGIFDWLGKPAKEINPGGAGQILGFTEVPAVGSVIEVFDNNKDYSKAAKIKSKILEIKAGELPVLIKTKTSGSLEALLASLPKAVFVVGSGVGDVSESDVLFAHSAKANIYCFEAKIPSNVLRLADTEGVEVETFGIIYELLQKLEEILKKDAKEVLGKAEILAAFPYESKRVAGSKVMSGNIKKTDKLMLVRGEKELGAVRIISMRKIKTEVLEARAGEELGILFDPQLDFMVGDMLLSIG